MTYDDAIIRRGLLLTERNNVRIEINKLDCTMFNLDKQIGDLNGAIAIMEQEKKERDKKSLVNT